MTENELRLLTPGAEFDPDPIIMSEETLSHLQNLIWDMMELAGNQEKRNELGVEPLRPYLDAIEQIDSLEEMTEYLKNSDSMNFTGENLVNFTVDRPENTRDFYTVHIGSPEHCLLVSFSNYRGIDNPSHDKRVLGRIPRIIVLAVFELVFIFSVMSSWKSAAGTYTSVKLLESTSTFLGTSFMLFIGTMDFIQSFNYDFSAKTIQVAIGIGISRLQIIISKLIQTTLVILTDALVTIGIFFVLSFITRSSLAPHQFGELFIKASSCILLVSCATALTMPLIFRTKSMIIPLICFSVLWLGLVTYALRMILRNAPTFVTSLQLDRLTHDSCIGEILTDALIGRFQLMPWIGTVFWFALGIYLTWLAFRKMELDF